MPDEREAVVRGICGKQHRHSVHCNATSAWPCKLAFLSVGHLLRLSVLRLCDCTSTYSKFAHALRSSVSSLGHAVMGDSVKLRRLEEPWMSTRASSGGDSLTTSLVKASRNEAVFTTLTCMHACAQGDLLSGSNTPDSASTPVALGLMPCSARHDERAAAVPHDDHHEHQGVKEVFGCHAAPPHLLACSQDALSQRTPRRPGVGICSRVAQ